MLDFKQFQEYALDHIREYLPEELKSAHVELNEVNKNNGKVLQAIIVRPKDSVVAPTVYLNGFYRSYEDGADLKSVMKEIADTSAKNQSPEEFENIAQDYRDFEFVKDKIVMNLVNAQRNEEMLKNTPHIMHEDLAITYRVVLGNDGQGMASITIKQPHVDAWGVSLDTIHERAMENSERLLPVTVQSMDEVMLSMMGESGMPKEMLEEMLGEIEDRPKDEMMYVITNSAKLNGAASIVYSNALDKLAEKVGTDLYVLPSSVHEVIAVSTNMGNPEELAAMVREVNAGEVSEDEQLSDHVYKFDAKSHTLSLADTSMENLQRVMVSEDTKQYASETQNNSRPRHR